MSSPTMPPPSWSRFPSQREAAMSVEQEPSSDVESLGDDVKAMTPAPLSFWQRHFTKPVPTTIGEKLHPPTSSRRRLSLRSRGFLLLSSALALVFMGVVAAAVAVTMLHRKAVLRDLPVRIAINANFPDPAIYYANGTWYAYGTNNAAGILDRPLNASNVDYGTANIQLATSSDFSDWTVQPPPTQPLPATGAWSKQGLADPDEAFNVPALPKSQAWAPAIIQRPSDGSYVMYYTAAANESSFSGIKRPTHCIGAAIASSPTGPFTPSNTSLACPLTQGGAIDPFPILDVDGTLWLTYKIDGNNLGHGGECGNTIAPIVPTPIQLQQLQPDGLTPTGSPVTILDRIPSDGPLIEGPSLIRSDQGIYFLFYSSGCTRNPDYTVRYATATSLTGPYVRAAAPLLKTGDSGLLAPGSASCHLDPHGQWNMAFHARVFGEDGGVRAMFTTRLLLDGHVATLTSTATSN